MNFAVILRNVGNAIRNAGGRGLLVAQAHAPEILVGTGLLGFGATIVGACKATAKTHDIIDEKEHALQVLKNAEDGVLMTSGERGLETYKNLPTVQAVERDARRRIFLCYLPVVTGGVVSGLLILMGFRIINGRLVATAAAYKTLEAGFDRYRGNVVQEFGKEVDWRMLNDIPADGFEKESKEEAEIDDALAQKELDDFKKFKRNRRAHQDTYSVIFDQYSDRWQSWFTPEQAWRYLVRKQREANDMLDIRGHVFLNEVYDLLGVERTTEGAVVGWIKDKRHPNTFVSFGLEDIPESRKREFLGARTNEDIWIRLYPNPMGVIYTMIGKNEQKERQALYA